MKNIFSRTLLFLAFFGCLAGHSTTALAADAEVRISTNKPLWKISKHLLGTHFVYCNEADAIYADGRIADWMKSVHVGIARWPGGTSVKFWHWNHPTGVLKGDDWDPKYDRSQNRPASEFMDLDEYLAFAQRSGAEPMIGVNLQSGWELKRVPDGIAEAVSCMQHCLAKGVKVKWWYLGNEEGMKTRDLAVLVNRYADAMRKVDPDIKIIINNDSQNPAKALEDLLPIAGRNIDVYEIHWKWPGWQDEGTPERWMQDTPLFGGSTATRLAALRAKAATMGFPKLLVANNEWGLSIKMKGFDKYTIGLVAVEYLLELFRSGFDMACYWTTQWPRVANIHLLDPGKNYALNPVARGFELLSPALNQQMIESTSTRPDVRGFACRDESGRTVQFFLINKTAEATQLKVTLDDKPTADRSKVSAQVMKTPGEKLESLQVTSKGDHYTTLLPPFSVCRLVFEK